MVYQTKNIKRLSIIIASVVFAITLSQFLSIDTTDNHKYINSSYVCSHFAYDLIMNASRYNLYLDYVYLEDRNHMVVGCYDPIAGKYVFVEPQTDRITGYDEVADKNFTVTVLRQATVYGLSYRMRFDLAVNGMVKALFENGKIRIMRDGTQWRPFVHVKDTSIAFIKVMESEPEPINGQTFNVGSNDQNIQIFDLAKTIAEACGQEFKYEWYGDPDKRSYKVSFDKIREVLGYETKHSIAEGAKEIWQKLSEGTLNPKDPRTITVKWYKQMVQTPNRNAQTHKERRNKQ